MTIHDRIQELTDIAEIVTEQLEKDGVIHLWEDENPWLVGELIEKEINRLNSPNNEEIVEAIDYIAHARRNIDLFEPDVLVDELEPFRKHLSLAIIALEKLKASERSLRDSEDICVWRHDTYHDSFVSNCGGEMYCEYGPPTNYGHNYCPRCGGIILIDGAV